MRTSDVRTWGRMWLIAGALLLPAIDSAARTWRVERDGSGDFTTIQPAVDASAPGDTVRIGAGQYTETTIFPFDGEFGQGETYVGVAVSDLTLIGAHRDSVVIGPDVPNFNGFDPKGIAMQYQTAQTLRVEHLTVQNVREGLRLWAYAEVRDCHVTGCELGVLAISGVGLRVEACTFEACTFTPVDGYGARDIEIVDSQFVNNGGHVLFSSTQNSNVRRCSFQAYGVMYELGASGTVEDCTFDVPDFTTCVDLSQTSDVWTARNRMLGPSAKVVASGHSAIGGAGNLMGPSTRGYMLRIIGETQADFRHNDILPGAPDAVHLESYMDPQQPVTLDFTDNWWGTTDSTAIAAKIWDGNDDPGLHGYVQFEPVRSQSVPTQKRSFGGLKAGFDKGGER